MIAASAIASHGVRSLRVMAFDGAVLRVTVPALAAWLTEAGWPVIVALTW